MWYETMAGGYLNQSFVQAFVCMGLGCLFNVWITKLKEHKFSTTTRVLLTIAQLVCAGIVVYHTLFTTNFYFTTIHALCAILIFLTLLNEDYLTKLLNHRIWKYPGKLALYIYMLHFPIIDVLYKSFNITNLACLAIITVVVTVGLSMLLMFIVDYVITPRLNRKKEVVASK